MQPLPRGAQGKLAMGEKGRAGGGGGGGGGQHSIWCAGALPAVPLEDLHPKMQPSVA